MNISYLQQSFFQKKKTKGGIFCGLADASCGLVVLVVSRKKKTVQTQYQQNKTYKTNTKKKKLENSSHFGLTNYISITHGRHSHH